MNLPALHLNPVAVLVILAVASYRLQRIVTTDSWLPFQWWRTYLNRKAQPATQEGRQNFWTETAELFSCPWCFGFWTTAVVFAEHYYLNVVPLLVYAFLAAAGVVGLLGSHDE